jgi:hypothetical protein
MSNSRSLNVIASEIRNDWKSVNYGAKPYLDAMGCLTNVSDNFGMDTGKSIVLYFLSNASTYRTPKAKELKLELKALLKNS